MLLIICLLVSQEALSSHIKSGLQKNSNQLSQLSSLSKQLEADHDKDTNLRPMQDEHDYEEETTSEDSILTFQGIIADAILQMFIYLKEGYTLTEILEGNSSLRSAKIISPKLG